MDFRNTPAAEKWGERGLIRVTAKILPHTPYICSLDLLDLIRVSYLDGKQKKVQLPLQ